MLARGVLRSTASGRPIPHQHPSSYLSDGLIRSVDRPQSVQQLQLPIGRVVLAQRDDEDRRQTRQPMNLREQQRSSCKICAEVVACAAYLLGKAAFRVAATESRSRGVYGVAGRS